jgi:hypothetical protein
VRSAQAELSPTVTWTTSSTAGADLVLASSQHTTRPDPVHAHVAFGPAAIPTASTTPGTSLGVTLVRPQQVTLRLAWIAHACSPSAASDARTVAGCAVGAVV